MTTEEMQQMINEGLDKAGVGTRPITPEELIEVTKEIVQRVVEKAKADGDFRLPDHSGDFPVWLL